MSEKMKSKISNNPSFAKLRKDSKVLKRFCRFVRLGAFLGLKNKKFLEICQKFENQEKATKRLISLPDKFNKQFSNRGWIAYERFNNNLMEEVVKLADEGNAALAEDKLIQFYDAHNIQIQLTWFLNIEGFRKREKLFQLALDDYLNKRYHSCIPNLLMIVDGIVNDEVGLGFFTPRINLLVIDSIAAHKSGLHKLRKLLSKKRKKTNTEEIIIPYRHGILHGRDLVFANQANAAKCWALLFAIRDFILEKRKDEKRQKEKKSTKKQKSLFKIILETEEFKQKLNEWKPRKMEVGKNIPKKGEPSVFQDETPEKALVDFLTFWKKKNYGKMAKGLLRFNGENPISKFTGEVRQDFSLVELDDFELISVTDKAPARAEIKVRIFFKKSTKTKTKTITVLLNHFNKDNEPKVFGLEKGEWKIIGNGFWKLIFEA